MNKALLILGAGGHAKVLHDAISQTSASILGIVSPDIPRDYPPFQNLPHVMDDDEVLNFDSQTVLLVNGIGSLPGQKTRQLLYEHFTKAGFVFETIISPQSIVSPSAKIAQGVQIMAGAIVQAGAEIGCNTIVNTGAIVDHDCEVGEHNHIAPGVVLSGGVKTGRGVHIGTNAAIIQSISIGDESTIGAGATITKDVAPRAKALGARFTVKKV